MDQTEAKGDRASDQDDINRIAGPACRITCGPHGEAVGIRKDRQQGTVLARCGQQLRRCGQVARAQREGQGRGAPDIGQGGEIGLVHRHRGIVVKRGLGGGGHQQQVHRASCEALLEC